MHILLRWFLILLSAGPMPQPASLAGLGDLAGGGWGSCALAISTDGEVVTGWATNQDGSRAFRWSGGAMSELEDGAADITPMVGHALSADGAVIVGQAQSRSGPVAFRWQGGKTIPLPSPAGLEGSSDAWGVSADGEVVVGYLQAQGQDEALVWRRGAADGLPRAAEARSSTAQAISLDSGIIAGSLRFAEDAEAVLWRGESIVRLGDLPGGAFGSAARAISETGEIIVGSALSAFGTEGFKWQAGVMHALGSVSREHEFLSVARGVSGDGAVIVGHAIDDRDASQAVVWDEFNGARTLAAALGGFDVELAGWRLEAATGVSRDGTSIVGCGRNPRGETEGWIARLPANWWKDQFVPYEPSPSLANDHGGAQGIPRLGRGLEVWTDLHEPQGAAVSADGRIYIADAGQNRVRVIQPDAAARNWGSPGSGLRFHQPHDVAVDETGSVFVADTGGHQVLVVSPDGRLRRRWGQFGTEVRDLCYPEGIAVSGERIYVADTGNDRIQVFNKRGEHLGSRGGFGRSERDLADPCDVAVGSKGTIYVADRGNDRVCAFEPMGDKAGCWGERGSSPGMFNRPTGVECAGGRVYVVDYGNHRVQVFGEQGTFLYAWGLQARRPHEGGGRIIYPARLALAPNLANAVVCEPHEQRCQFFGMFDASATPSREFDKLLDVGALTHMGGAMHASGNYLAVTDVTADFVLVYRLTDHDPVLITKIGTPGSGPGQLCDPAGLWLDAESGDLVVADAGNRRVQVFSLRLPADDIVEFRPNLARLVKTIDVAAAGLVEKGAAWRPGAVARSKDGVWAIVDSNGRGVLLLDRDFSHPRWAAAPAGARLLQPVDVDFARDGRVLVLDAGAAGVIVFDVAGSYIESWDWGEAVRGGGSYGGMEAVEDGSVYVTDKLRHAVLKLDAYEKTMASWGKKGVGAGEFVQPRAVAHDLRGRIYVNDFGNRRIQIFTPDGEFIRAFGPPLTVHPTLVDTAD